MKSSNLLQLRALFYVSHRVQCPAHIHLHHHPVHSSQTLLADPLDQMAQSISVAETPGNGAAVLSAWLVVRRRAFLTLSKRRYVVLTDDHVLLVDSTPVLHLVDCRVATHASAKVIDLIPAPGSGLSVRIFADSPFQYSKWRLALQNSAAASLQRFYRLATNSFLGSGVHGVVRRAYPEMPYREDSTDSATTASEYSLQTSEQRTAPRNIFKRRGNGNRNSVDLDPDHAAYSDQLSDPAVPSSRMDKRILRQMSLKGLNQPPLALHDGLAGETTSVAVKTVSRSSSGSVTVASEVLVAKARLNHFGIVRVLDLFEAVNEVHIVMEECKGASLRQYLAANVELHERDVRAVFSPIVKAIGYMHACGIVHWDVNPDNIMFGNAHALEPKIIDFGTARPIDASNGRVPQNCGVFAERGRVASLACASPEQLTSKAHRYASKTDMWQLGCVLYFLLLGKLPFHKRNAQDISVSSSILAFCKKRSPSRREFLFNEDTMGKTVVSEAAVELVLKLLCPNPRMRPNALQCLKEFSFFNYAL